MNLKRSYPIHPLLFVIYPVLALYAHNVKEVLFTEIGLYCALAMGAATMLFAVFYCVLRDIKKAALATTAFVLLTLFYMPVHVALEIILRKGLHGGIFLPPPIY